MQGDTRRSLQLHALAVVLSVPWLSIAIGWRTWPAWLLVIAVYFGSRWLMDELTGESDVRELRERIAALERPGQTRQPDPKEAPWPEP